MMILKKRKEPIHFEKKADRNAHKSFLMAIETLGGPSKASELSGIMQSQISIIKHGRKKAQLSLRNKRKQEWPTPEQAMRISTLLNMQISAEELLPHHDFSYIYEYANLVKRKKK